MSGNGHAYNVELMDTFGVVFLVVVAAGVAVWVLCFLCFYLADKGRAWRMNAEQRDAELWTTPEAVRATLKSEPSGAMAAQEIISIMDAVPLDVPLTSDDWAMLVNGAKDDANTAFLDETANW